MTASSTVLAPDVSQVEAEASAHLSVGQSVTRGALALLSTQPLTWGASLLAAAVVPRLLGAEALGQFTIATSITALASTAAGLGISEYLVRRIAQHSDTLRYDLGLALVLQTVAACVGAVAIAVLGPLLSTSVIDSRLLYIVLIGMVAAPAQGVLLASFRGREKLGQYAWVNAVTAVVTTVGGVLVLIAGADVLAFAATSVALSVLSTAIAWRISGVRPVLPPVRSETFRQMLEVAKAGFPFLTWALTLTVYGSIDRLLLGVLVPASELGWYVAAYRVIGIAVFIPSMVVSPLFPALSRSAQAPHVLRNAIAKTLKIAMLLTMPISAGIIVVAPVVPGLLGWPEEFANAIPLMAILSLHLPIVAIDMVLGVVVMAIGREKKWVVVGLLACVFNIVINLVCIPVFEHVSHNGAIGAAIVTVLTEILMFFGAFVLIPQHLMERGLIWDGARVLLASCATVAVGVALLPIALPLAVVGGALIYVGVAVVLRALTLQDIRQFRSLVSPRATRSARPKTW